jgi:hypothetical protein
MKVLPFQPIARACSKTQHTIVRSGDQKAGSPKVTAQQSPSRLPAPRSVRSTKETWQEKSYAKTAEAASQLKAEKAGQNAQELVRDSVAGGLGDDISPSSQEYRPGGIDIPKPKA